MKQVEYSINYKHDQLGYRNPCYKELNPNLEEIILGDSFVYGQGVNDQYTFNCQFIKNGISIYSLNLPGASIPEYLIMIKKNIENIRKKFPNIKKLNLVLFLGNDFESLVNLKVNNIQNKEIVHNKVNVEKEKKSISKEVNQSTKNLPSSELKISIKKEAEFKILLQKLNRFIVKTPFINQSYTITGVKLLIKPLIHSSDKGDFIKTYAGSTLYKSSVEMPLSQLEKSFNYLIKEISKTNLSFNKIILIEDPVVVDNERFLRDMRLANFSPKLINLRFKISAIKVVCKKLSLSCIDTTGALTGKDFYVYDNHLNNIGSERLIKYLSQNFKID